MQAKPWSRRSRARPGVSQPQRAPTQRRVLRDDLMGKPICSCQCICNGAMLDSGKHVQHTLGDIHLYTCCYQAGTAVNTSKSAHQSYYTLYPIHCSAMSDSQTTLYAQWVCVCVNMFQGCTLGCGCGLTEGCTTADTGALCCEARVVTSASARNAPRKWWVCLDKQVTGRGWHGQQCATTSG